ncbi:MAG: hypothetical protein K6E49_10460 [Lachnospiraceae bacterium]|nr:hypothetical protein [Lachnospiraceae bacterium]
MTTRQWSNRKISAVSLAVAVLAGVITSFTDRAVFTFPDRYDERFATALTDYCTCKVIAMAVVFMIAKALLTVVFTKGERRDAIIKVVRYALIYLPVAIIVLIIKLPQGYITNDEISILNDATGLIHDTWFNYMTVYFYIVSLMLMPFKYGPIFIKVIIELLVIGYSVYRCVKYFGRGGMFIYALFLLYPFIAYTTSAHRLPVYFLIYLLLFGKLLFDLLEKEDISKCGAFFALLAGAVLTQWRTEGIYLLVLIPVLMMIAYPRYRSVRGAAVLIVSYIAIQYILWIPQNGALSRNLDGAANDRMKPFYAYTITNMYRNGLDPVKNSRDLETVDRYLSLEAIEKINEHYGDINYEDVLILYKDGFVGVREEATDDDFIQYSQALKRIFAANPDVFARTRWGAFCYAAMPFHITFSGTGVRELASFFISIVKSVSYNLFIPLLFCLFECVYCVIRRKWFCFFVFGGLLAHWFIVFVLAPASYFKYYFPIYIMSYFYMILLLIWYFYGRRKGKACPVA